MTKPLIIGGEHRLTGEAWANINPSDTNDVIDEFAVGNIEDTTSAISAAADAAEGWATASPLFRAEILDRAGQMIHDRREELGRLLSREEGKVLAEGIGEATRAAQVFKFYAQEALRVDGVAIASIRPGVRVETRDEPVGVVGLITPWNFPIAIPAWKLAPALAFGNTAVLKPAELTPGCAWELIDILHQAGLPAGVANLVTGPGSVVGDALVRDERVSAISFTGSVATGAQVRRLAAERGARVQQEMGGKSPLIVLDDADLDTAADCAVSGSVISTGQRCTSNTRIIATPGIHDALVAAMAEKVSALRVGNALDPDTQIGPVVDQKQLDIDLDYLDVARKEGGEIVCGGDLLSLQTPGFYLSPAVVTGATNEMVHVREEIFGPVVSVLKAADYDEALTIANDSPLGLSSGICTTSLKYAEDFKSRSAAGMVMVNLPTAGVDFHVPFGGRKGSSYGPREQGRASRAFYTSSKTCYTSS